MADVVQPQSSGSKGLPSPKTPPKMRVEGRHQPGITVSSAISTGPGGKRRFSLNPLDHPSAVALATGIDLGASGSNRRPKRHHPHVFTHPAKQFDQHLGAAPKPILKPLHPDIVAWAVNQQSHQPFVAAAGGQRMFPTRKRFTKSAARSAASRSVTSSQERDGKGRQGQDRGSVRQDGDARKNVRNVGFEGGLDASIDSERTMSDTFEAEKENNELFFPGHPKLTEHMADALKAHQPHCSRRIAQLLRHFDADKPPTIGIARAGGMHKPLSAEAKRALQVAVEAERRPSRESSRQSKDSKDSEVCGACSARRFLESKGLWASARHKEGCVGAPLPELSPKSGFQSRRVTRQSTVFGDAFQELDEDEVSSAQVSSKEELEGVELDKQPVSGNVDWGPSFEYFFVCGVSTESLIDYANEEEDPDAAKVVCGPEIVTQFPFKKTAEEEEETENALEATVADFCFPHGYIEARRLSTPDIDEGDVHISDIREHWQRWFHTNNPYEESNLKTFVFTVTRASIDPDCANPGELLYGCCVIVDEIVIYPEEEEEDSDAEDKHSTESGEKPAKPAPPCTLWVVPHVYCLVSQWVCFETWFGVINSVIASRALLISEHLMEREVALQHPRYWLDDAFEDDLEAGDESELFYTAISNVRVPVPARKFLNQVYDSPFPAQECKAIFRTGDCGSTVEIYRPLLEPDIPFPYVHMELKNEEENQWVRRWACDMLWKVMPVDQVLTLLTGTLLETKVAIRSSSLAVRTRIVLALRTFIYPFRWLHPFLPVCAPAEVAEHILESPIIALVGLDAPAKGQGNDGHDCTVVNLDTGGIRGPRRITTAVRFPGFSDLRSALQRLGRRVTHTPLRGDVTEQSIFANIESDEREALEEMTTLTCACIERMAIKIQELSSHIHRVATDRGLQEPLSFAEAAAAYEWV